MMEMTKSSHMLRVVTCCYCNARSTLSGDRTEHLVCHGCGAPIRQIEVLHPDLERRRRKGNGKKPAMPHHAERPHKHLDKDRPSRRKKGKRKKRSFFDRLADSADDLFDLDDLFDIDLFD